MNQDKDFVTLAKESIQRHLNTVTDSVEKQKILKRMRSSFQKGSMDELKKSLLLRRNPVNIQTFIEDRDFFGFMKDELYPKIVPELIEMNSGKYIEVVFTGAIGVGKTTCAIITNAYQLYLLSCYTDPHELFGLAKSDEIVFIFQNLNAKLAKDVDFARFKANIDRSPYFKEEFKYDKMITSELKFQNHIVVKPVSGQGTAAIGQNVFGGFIDEINFMQIVEKSKQTRNEGVYDQAAVVYNSIARRRESRFMVQGNLPGILCLGSSKQYPGQFTDRKVAEAEDQIKKYGKSLIYVYDKRPWDVLPEERFTGKYFKVFIGDDQRKPRIMEENEEIPLDDLHLVMDVPIEYRNSFEADIMNALRDIAGVSTLAKHPFLMNYEAVTACFGKKKSVLSRPDCDFVTSRVAFSPKEFYQPELPRWVHIDLAITGDSAGVTLGCVDRFVEIRRGPDVERLPHVHIDAILEVKPPKGGEILFYKIREIIYKLREYGLNIKWVSFDSYQSTDSIQILRQKGFITGIQSMDVNTIPYDTLKTALYDGRVSAPAHEKCQKELVSLEMDTKKKKIDHPPHSSKDCSDALCGVVYGLTMRREVWAMFNVPITDIPSSIKTLIVKTSDKMKKSEIGDL